MQEIIIKVVERPNSEYQNLKTEIAKVLDVYNAKLKSVLRDKNEDGSIKYENQIWQIGEKEVDPSTWRLLKDEEKV